VSDQIETVVLAGRALGVGARRPLPVEPRTLAVAAALRLFERYPVFESLSLTVGDTETTVSRETLERVVGLGGFAALRDPARYRQALHDALEGAPGARE
jgi:hypothetical protein